MPENSHHYNASTLFLKFLKLLIVLCIVSNRTRTRILDLRKNGPLGKTGPQGLKTLSFFSRNVKDNVEVIHFHIKSRGVQGLAFVQITFENCTLNFYFENSELGIKKTIANLQQPLLAWNVSACLRIFMQPRFKGKRVFMQLATFFISSSRRIFTKLLSVSESSIKTKFRSRWTLFLILLTSAVIYFSSYLQTKTSVWKQYCAISSKLQML